MHDAVSIHWPNDARRLNKVLRKGEIESRIVPRQLKVPGGKVVLVDEKQNALVIGTVTNIVEDVQIKDLEGDIKTGCILKLKKGSFRRPRKSDRKKVAVVKKWLGAFYYLDSDFRPVNTDGGGYVTVPKSEDLVEHESGVEFLEYTGEGLSTLELELVERYMKWIGDYPGFCQPHFKRENLFADLFIPRYYCLIEAKSNIWPTSIRMATGQLFDYHFCFKNRKPSLSVLLPEKPSKRYLDLLRKRKITVIWETPSGRFNDSHFGKYTVEFRKEIKQKKRSSN